MLLTSTGSNRMVGHIVKCEEMPKVIKNGFKALQERRYRSRRSGAPWG